MQYNFLGNTNINVSRLCFGALTIGPTQCNMSVDFGADIISYAISRGINFVDTAQLYKTYPYIKQAMKQSNKYDLVIASKTYAYDVKSAKKAVDEALFSIERDYIDIFLLHEQESIHTLRGHKEALDYLLECKEKGIIKAVGLSTHHIAGVTGLLNTEFINLLDIVFPMINIRGVGIVDGGIDEMLSAVELAYKANKGIYAMKVLGGGTLINEYEKAMDFALSLPYLHSIAMGMQSYAEIDANISYFENRLVPDSIKAKLNLHTRRLHIEDWCIRCGNCISACNRNALYINENSPNICVDETKCVACGYCGRECKNFALKII